MMAHVLASPPQSMIDLPSIGSSMTDLPSIGSSCSSSTAPVFLAPITNLPGSSHTAQSSRDTHLAPHLELTSPVKAAEDGTNEHLSYFSGEDPRIALSELALLAAMHTTGCGQLQPVFNECSLALELGFWTPYT